MQPVCRRTLQQDEDVELPRLEHVLAELWLVHVSLLRPVGARGRLKRKRKERGSHRRAQPAMASQRRGARGVRGKRVVDDARRARVRRQIFKTKAEPQRIVATGPLCRVQHPVSYSSRLQGIHRAGSGNCGRSRLVRYGCAWLPPRGGPPSVRHGF